MAWTKSSNLKSIWYSRETKMLTVAFQGGRAYRYPNVPYSVFLSLKTAPSKGRYFYYHIRDTFPYFRVR